VSLVDKTRVLRENYSEKNPGEKQCEKNCERKTVREKPGKKTG
jgi:hypothetical protein